MAYRTQALTLGGLFGREQQACEAITVIAKVCNRLPAQDALLVLRRVREDVLERLQDELVE